jgi:hypothetical protein
MLRASIFTVYFRNYFPKLFWESSYASALKLLASQVQNPFISGVPRRQLIAMFSKIVECVLIMSEDA